MLIPLRIYGVVVIEDVLQNAGFREFCAMKISHFLVLQWLVCGMLE